MSEQQHGRDEIGSVQMLGVEDELRARYRQPTELVKNKTRPKVDPQAARYIAASPLMVLATSSADGTDASPRGGSPGFVKVLDENHLAFADLSGNNRLDSYANIVNSPEVGLLFFVPGSGETLRVNGRAGVTADPAVLEHTADGAMRPKVAVVVEVGECFIHCAKAVRRSGVWDPTTWLEPDEWPTGAEIIVDQHDLPYTADDIETSLEEDYQATLWREGGD